MPSTGVPPSEDASASSAPSSSPPPPTRRCSSSCTPPRTGKLPQCPANQCVDLQASVSFDRRIQLRSKPCRKWSKYDRSSCWWVSDLSTCTTHSLHCIPPAERRPGRPRSAQRRWHPRLPRPSPVLLLRPLALPLPRPHLAAAAAQKPWLPRPLPVPRPSFVSASLSLPALLQQRDIAQVWTCVTGWTPRQS